MKQIILAMIIVFAAAALLFADTKEELLVQKAVITAKISALATAEGKTAFVVAKMAEIDAVREKLKQRLVAKNQVSMFDFLSLIKTGIVKDPNAIIAREIQRLTVESVNLAAALAKTEPNAIEKPIEVKPK